MYKYFNSKPNDSYKKMRPDMFWADLSDAYIGLDDFRGIDGKNYSYLYFCHSIITIWWHITVRYLWLLKARMSLGRMGPIGLSAFIIPQPIYRNKRNAIGWASQSQYE